MNERADIRKLDDLSLIREYESCTREAFRVLHRRYVDFTEDEVRQTAKNSLSREEVKEVNNQVWIRVLGIKDTIEPPDRNVAAWLKKIAKNRTIDELRRRGRISAKLISYEEAADQLGTPSSHLDDAAADLAYKDLMQKVLSTLTPKERIVMFLIYGADYKHKEVASLLDEPINTISSLAKRARDKIKKLRKDL